jgi:hypothetical protein
MEAAMWTKQEAQAKFDEVLRRALSGEAQVIGDEDSCVVISLAEYERLTALDDESHPRRWLVKHLAGLGEIELPPRGGRRPGPFDNWTEEDFADEAEIDDRLARLPNPSKPNR